MNLKGLFYVADTETTGFNPGLNGDRLIEVAFIEVKDGVKTGRYFHEYVDPMRDVPLDAYKVHGWSREDLVSAGNGQKFHDIAEKLLNFVKDGTVVFHNAPFDTGFLDFELKNAGYSTLSSQCKVFDTLSFANAIFPRQRNNLDALCKRLEVDNSNREYHGALLDSELLVDVFLKLIDEQPDIDFDNIKTVMPARTIDVRPIDSDLSKLLTTIEVKQDDLMIHHEKMNKIRPQIENSPSPGM